MTYFADLTDYTFISSDDAFRPGTQNVGWLSAKHAFETAPPTEQLLDRLWSYCCVSVVQTWGIHQCDLCPGKNTDFAERKGETLWLGTAEIRVFGEGCIYAAPTLIYHYVKEHGYKPPEPFVHALKTQPAPPAAEYFDRLTRESFEWHKTSNGPQSESNDPPFRARVQFPSDPNHKPGNLKSAIRLRDIALLLVGGLIGGGFLSVIGVFVARFFTDSKFVAGIVAGIALYGSWLLGYQWLAKGHGWDRLSVRFSATRPKVLLAAAASAVAMLLLTSAVAYLLRRLGVNVQAPPASNFLPRKGSQLIFALVLIAVIAPLAEELIFRGLLLDWLRQKINVWAAALILSVIFSLLHNNPFKLGAIGVIAFGARMTLGLILSAFAIRSSSLRASFVMHATFNGVICVASVLG